MSNKLPVVMVRVLLAVFAAWSVCEAFAAVGSEQVVRATLNGLEITLDAKTGSILGLTYPGPGRMLEATPEAAGILDLACPEQKHPALRRASRFSTGAKISQTVDRVTIDWENLAASRSSPDSSGRVSAAVTLEAAPDGRSVILSCRIENQSDAAITQVLFPDFVGLLPFGGAGGTQLRLGGTVICPFVSLRASAPEPIEGNSAIATYTSGGLYSPMVVRWMDLGSLTGGMSLFPKRWGLDPPTTVNLHLWETNKRLRLMVPHQVNVVRGKSWESGQFVITPHISGWAKGIEPYRAWVRQNIKRIVPMPEHVRRGLGFRTIWLSRNYPDDPQDANWTFRDLVPLAEESKEHGLDEMVLWGCHEYFLLPLPPFWPHLGGNEGLVRAVAECKKRGINVAPFISVCNAKEKTAARYGLKQVHTGWTYHTEFIPRFNPPYAGAYRCAQISTHHPVWQREVLDSCKGLVNLGIPSLSWDQYFIEPPEPNLLTLTRQIRQHSRQRDPQSTFSAEDVGGFELAADYLDYTWDWGAYRDIQPLINAFPAPRPNQNIDASPAEAKRCFLQNSYLNVQPRKPDGTNGSDWIRNHPELSRALKQCAKLRTQFLPYFVDGTLIGDCILSKPCSGAEVCAYVLPKRILVIVLNTGGKGEVRLVCDPRPWLESAAGGHLLRSYDGAGRLTAAAEIPKAERPLVTGILDRLDVALFEIASQ